jgi:hypothetical protein
MLMAQFTIFCSDPAFHEEPEPERRARLNRVLAILRRELPNLLTPVSFSPYNEIETIIGEGDNGTHSRVLRKAEHG